MNSMYGNRVGIMRFKKLSINQEVKSDPPMNSDSPAHPIVMIDGKTIDERLLVICHSYNNFQKDSIEGTSEYINKINALVRTNPFAEITNFIPISHLERFRKSKKIDLSSKPLNIDVTDTPLYYIPWNIFYKSLGEKHYEVAEKAIQRKQMQFDLVHAHFTWSAGFVGARLKEKYGVPFVVTAHGYDIYSLPFIDNEWRNKIEYVLNAADRIVTVSRSNQACIMKLNVSTPVTVIPNGFKSGLFYPRDSSECRKILNLPREKKIILTVGNLEPVKGQKYLVDAFKTINSERKDAICAIVGGGRLQHALKRQIHSLGLDDIILLAGGKPHEDIPLWMNACDLFVLPSLNEGNPTVMFEALGCGKPFLGTKVGGIPEIIISNDYGHLVEPADSNDLAQKILVSLNQAWDSMKIRAYAERYDWDNASREIIRVYEQIRH